MTYVRKKRLEPKAYVDGILKGDRILLSKAITLIESALPEDNELAEEVLSTIIPYTGNSMRIGITGVPGVGKSTFIESFGKHVTSLDKKLAVLTIDPSSQRSKGAILGDKTRMESLATDPNAYIRPSASGFPHRVSRLLRPGLEPSDRGRVGPLVDTLGTIACIPGSPSVPCPC